MFFPLGTAPEILKRLEEVNEFKCSHLMNISKEKGRITKVVAIILMFSDDSFL